MTLTPLIQLNGIGLSFGGKKLFSNLDLIVNPNDRIALVGKNGSGKSTLMKVLAGLIETDLGSRISSPNIKVSYMEQDPDLNNFDTLGEYAHSKLSGGEAYKVDAFSRGLKLNLHSPVSSSSGGEKRRVSIAKLLAEQPEVMLLDEPTNHLDINAITWLEEELKKLNTAFIIISHDRKFLSSLSTSTVWIDDGKTRRHSKSFSSFEDWRDQIWAEEDAARHKLKRKILAETRWAIEGISGRRKRNMGRVRALKTLKEKFSNQGIRKNIELINFEPAEISGKQTIVANKITKSFSNTNIISNFSIKVGRGERIAIIGPNGAGKTTLLKLLVGELSPDQGTVKLGTNLKIAIFDQNREILNSESTLWESLTNSSETEVIGKGDYVSVRGETRHVVGYLKDFLFDESQFRSPVSSLSGGEKARLILAKIMAKDSNLLVLDEPTNDLDIETLDLLQELIADYQGTVLLVSHDRDFIDRISTSTIAIEEGSAIVYAGGWSDYLSQKKGSQKRETLEQRKVKLSNKKTKIKSKKSVNTKNESLTFTQQHRLKSLPKEIRKIELEIKRLTELLSDMGLFERDEKKFLILSEGLVERQRNLSILEEEWLILEEKNSEV